MECNLKYWDTETDNHFFFLWSPTKDRKKKRAPQHVDGKHSLAAAENVAPYADILKRIAHPFSRLRVFREEQKQGVQHIVSFFTNFIHCPAHCRLRHSNKVFRLMLESSSPIKLKCNYGVQHRRYRGATIFCEALESTTQADGRLFAW